MLRNINDALLVHNENSKYMSQTGGRNWSKQ